MSSIKQVYYANPDGLRGAGEFRCSDKDLPIFLLGTSYGLWTRRHTTLLCATSGSRPQTFTSEIDWVEKSITVQGVTKPLSEVKRYTGPIWTTSLDWTWASRSYRTKFKYPHWIIKRGEDTLATLLTDDFTKRGEGPELVFLMDMENEEKVFIMLALAYRTLGGPLSLDHLNSKFEYVE